MSNYQQDKKPLPATIMSLFEEPTYMTVTELCEEFPELQLTPIQLNKILCKKNYQHKGTKHRYELTSIGSEYGKMCTTITPAGIEIEHIKWDAIAVRMLMTEQLPKDFVEVFVNKYNFLNVATLSSKHPHKTNCYACVTEVEKKKTKTGKDYVRLTCSNLLGCNVKMNVWGSPSHGVQPGVYVFKKVAFDTTYSTWHADFADMTHYKSVIITE